MRPDPSLERTSTGNALERMKANPLDWRIESLKFVAASYGLLRWQPGGSHVIFRHPNGTMLSVPARRPIKPVYVKNGSFVSLKTE